MQADGGEMLAADKRRLLDFCQNWVTDPDEIRATLSAVDFPRARIPISAGSTPEKMWRTVFDEIERGVLASLLPLLRSVCTRYPWNVDLRELSARYLDPATSGWRAQPASDGAPPKTRLQPGVPLNYGRRRKA
jgi:hypothetical protein